MDLWCLMRLLAFCLKESRRIGHNTCVLLFSGTSDRRDREEGQCSGITSCLEPLLPVPLFLYNSGEYFYLLFSKGSFFSSLIVETHFFMKATMHFEGDFIPSRICTSRTVIVCQFLFSKWEGVTPWVRTHTHTLRMAFTKTVGQLAQMTNIPLAQ